MSREGLVPALAAKLRATGMNMATAPVELINAERPATTSMSKINRRLS